MQSKSMPEHSISYDEGGWRGAAANQDLMVNDPDASSEPALTFESLFPDTLNSLFTFDDDMSPITTPFTSPRDSNLGSPSSITTPSPLIDYIDSMGDSPSLFCGDTRSTEQYQQQHVHSISPADTRLPPPSLDDSHSKPQKAASGRSSSHTASSSSMSPSPQPTCGSQRKRSTSTRATGFRTNVVLIPIDAPTQRRNYLGPSATSRKNLEAVAATLISTGATGIRSRKRSRVAAGLKPEGEDGPRPPPALRLAEEEDQLDEPPIHPNMNTREVELAKANLLEKLEDKRRKNALSARKSRMLKKETKELLEAEVDRLKGLLSEMGQDRDHWKELAEERGRSLGIKEEEET